MKTSCLTVVDMFSMVCDSLKHFNSRIRLPLTKCLTTFLGQLIRVRENLWAQTYCFCKNKYNQTRNEYDSFSGTCRMARQALQTQITENNTNIHITNNKNKTTNYSKKVFDCYSRSKNNYIYILKILREGFKKICLHYW